MHSREIREKTYSISCLQNFVDLGGSERASQALSAGTRLKEGCHINRSLLTLGTVIRKLRLLKIPFSSFCFITDVTGSWFSSFEAKLLMHVTCLMHFICTASYFSKLRFTMLDSFTYQFLTMWSAGLIFLNIIK